MLKTRLIVCVALGCNIILQAGTTSSCPISAVPAEVPPAAISQPKSHPAVIVTAELNHSRAFPGENVRLLELVPIGREIQVSRVTHTVHIIGQYDFATQTLVNRNPEKALISSARAVFDEWPGSVMAFGDKPFRYDVTNPRQEGLEFELKARQLGIYLIKAKWQLYHSEDVIESNPVILTVIPPLDKDGKPIIKEAWIDPIEWKHRHR